MADFNYEELRTTTVPDILRNFGQNIEITKTNRQNFVGGRVVEQDTTTYELLAVETTRSISGAQSRDQEIQGIESTDRIFHIESRNNAEIDVGDTIVVNGEVGVINTVKRIKPAAVTVMYTVGASFR